MLDDVHPKTLRKLVRESEVFLRLVEQYAAGAMEARMEVVSADRPCDTWNQWPRCPDLWRQAFVFAGVLDHEVKNLAHVCINGGHFGAHQTPYLTDLYSISDPFEPLIFRAVGALEVYVGARSTVDFLEIEKGSVVVCENTATLDEILLESARYPGASLLDLTLFCVERKDPRRG